MTRPSLQEDWVSSPANNLDIVFSWIDFNCSSAPLQPCNDCGVHYLYFSRDVFVYFFMSVSLEEIQITPAGAGTGDRTSAYDGVLTVWSAGSHSVECQVQDRYLVSSSHHLTNDKHCLWDHHRQPPPEHRDNTRNVQIVRTVDIDSNNGD